MAKTEWIKSAKVTYVQGGDCCLTPTQQ